MVQLMPMALHADNSAPFARFPIRGDSTVRPVSGGMEYDDANTYGPLVEKFKTNGARLPCMLGLSAGSSYLNRGWLTRIIQWLRPHCSSLVIVDGSFLHRWNLTAFEGLSEEAARSAARRDAIRIRRRIKSVLSELDSDPAVVTVLDWENTLEDAGYRRVAEAVTSFVGSNVEVREAICQAARAYASRRMDASHVRTSDRDSNERLEALTRAYVSEEISMLLWLYRENSPVDVYPGGDLEILRRICNGEFSDFPFDCPKRTHVSIRPRGECWGNLHLESHTGCIRPMVIEDQARVAEIVRSYPQHFVPEAGGLILKDAREQNAVVLERDGQVDAFAVWTANAVELEILWLATAPAARRQGCAAALIRHVEAQRRGQRVLLCKSADNRAKVPGTALSGAAFAGTHRLFERLGIKRRGSIESYWGPEDHCALFVKSLT